jgi:osmoprotectant transport system permease protein
MGYLLDPTHWDLSESDNIPTLFAQHLYITAIAVAIAMVIAFPIALLVVRYGRLYLPVINVAGVIYTIPSLAFLVVLIPFTGLGVTTLVIPLVAYAQVVLIRNIVAAIRAVDPGLVEVGRAMGMSPVQLQRRVVLPLALPVIVAGLRVATVTTIGIAMLGPWIGADDLGTLIYQGFNFARTDEIVAGVILASALAIGADLALLALQSALGRGRQVIPAS